MQKNCLGNRTSYLKGIEKVVTSFQLCRGLEQIVCMTSVVLALVKGSTFYIHYNNEIKGNYSQ